MGRRKDHHHHHHHRVTKSQTLPSSPTHSSSSSDFEFTVGLSPRRAAVDNCPADELFYKGQLLPLHLSPRLSMVRTLLLASSSSSGSSASSARDSTGSATSSNESRSSFSAADLLLQPLDCDSSRPSSATDDASDFNHLRQAKKTPKYLGFSLSRFSSVFRKEPKNRSDPSGSGSGPVRRMSKTAREVIGKYLKKVKPLYEKLSQNQNQNQIQKPPPHPPLQQQQKSKMNQKELSSISQSFSGNLRYPRRKSYVASCPSSIRSSPSHSGVLSRPPPPCNPAAYSSSSMEELHNAIQGAIAHCKNSMLQSSTTSVGCDKNSVVSSEI